MDQATHDQILALLPLAQAAANRCRQRQFREDVYQACCLKIVEVCTTWDGPEEYLENRIRQDLKHAAWSELGLCLRPFGHPKDYRTAQNLLAVVVEDMDPPQRLYDAAIEEDCRDIRQVVRAVIRSLPEEEQSIWLDVFLSGDSRRAVARRHEIAERWLQNRVWGVKSRLRIALERAGFKAA